MTARALLLVCLCALLLGCGQKGPLYRPDPGSGSNGTETSG